MEGEELLSEELRQALGGGEDVVLTCKKKDKDKERRPIVADEIVKQAKKLSKKQQKRVDQINKRKMREAHKGEYLKTISANEISSTQRQLLASAKSLGQSLSMRQTVALLLKKERAGMTLTDEEMEVLYPNKRDSDVVVDPEIFAPYINMDDSNADVVEENSNVDGTEQPLPSLDISDLFVPQQPMDPEPTVMEVSEILDTPEATEITRPLRRKVKRKPLRQHAVRSEEAMEPSQPTDLPSKPKKFAFSLGKNLLAQLNTIKDKHEASKEVFPDLVEVDRLNQIAEEQPIPDQVYRIEEITAPVTDLGVINPEVLKTLHRKPAGEVDKRVFVSVVRPADVVTSRMHLPVCGMEQEIVEAVRAHDVIIVCGETGSGKSTQIPQFLYEAGFGNIGLIGITQPRRVAVTSTAERVNYEMGQLGDKSSKDGRLVGYQIRYDSSTVGDKTRIKFMTDGILLREITHDLLLRHYSVLLLDEAHERNLNTDVLLGMLSRALPLRKQVAEEEQRVYNSLPPNERHLYQPPLAPLKVVIMSATLRVSDFQDARLFNPIPPVIQVDARQYPVTTHFAKKTELKNYLQATFRKVCQIHRRLPAGGILVFLTGKREILYMCHKLQRALGSKRSAPSGPTTKKTDDNDDQLGADAEEAFFDAEAAELDGDVDTGRGPSLRWSNVETSDEQGQAIIDFSEFDDATGLDEINSEASSIDWEEDDEEESDDSLSKDGDEAKDGEEKSGREEEESREIVMEEATEEDSDEEEEDEAAKLRRQMLEEVLQAKGATADDDHNSEPSADPSPNPQEVAEQPMENEVNDGIDEEEAPPLLQPLILPLYAMMPPALQKQIFKATPEGHRMIVIATNVAETSLTIPGISYVVDCGRQKAKVTSSTNKASSSDADAEIFSGSAAGLTVSRYEIQWVSKASADQRAGRAGRTGPGHCYRLYSSNFYHQYLMDFQPPEITTTPLEDLVLQMKALGIPRIEDFPFPTPPPMIALRGAIQVLKYLAAIATPYSSSQLSVLDRYNELKNKLKGNADSVESTKKSKEALWQEIVQRDRNEKLRGELTTIGRLMAKFPIHPRLSKILLIACRAVMVAGLEEGGIIVAHALTLVAGLAEKSPFVLDGQQTMRENEAKEHGDVDEEDEETEKVEEIEEEKTLPANPLLEHPGGDLMARLRAIGAFVFCCHQVLNSSGDKTAKPISPFHLHHYLHRAELLENPQIQKIIKDFHLHLPTLQRILDLRSQLQAVAAKVIESEGYLPSDASKEALRDILSPPLQPPTSEAELVLRQCLLAGFCDNVVRKATVSMIQGMYGAQKQLSRRKKYSAYLCAHPQIHEPVYLHPQSNLYPKDPTDQMPEYLLFHGLQRNTKGDALYMTEVTVIDAHWIADIASDSSLVKFSPPLHSPCPSYDWTADQIEAYSVPKYGNLHWKLPAVKKPMVEIMKLVEISSQNKELVSSNSAPMGYRKEDEQYRWFARFLLEGVLSIVPKTVLSAELCLVQPNTITQNKMHPKVSC